MKEETYKHHCAIEIATCSGGGITEINRLRSTYTARELFEMKYRVWRARKENIPALIIDNKEKLDSAILFQIEHGYLMAWLRYFVRDVIRYSQCVRRYSHMKIWCKQTYFRTCRRINPSYRDCWQNRIIAAWRILQGKPTIYRLDLGNRNMSGGMILGPQLGLRLLACFEERK